MKSLLPSLQAGAPSQTRRLKPATLARRCVGSLVVLAGIAIVAGDLLALLHDGDIGAVASATTALPTQHQLPTAR